MRRRARSRVLRVREAARSNSVRASGWRPSLERRLPARTLGEKMVARERGFRSEGVYECEAGLGAVGHGDGYGAVELDDGGGDELGELGVEDDDAWPVGFGWRASAGGGRRLISALEEIGAAGGVDFMSAFDCG